QPPPTSAQSLANHSRTRGPPPPHPTRIPNFPTAPWGPGPIPNPVSIRATLSPQRSFLQNILRSRRDCRRSPPSPRRGSHGRWCFSNVSANLGDMLLPANARRRSSQPRNSTDGDYCQTKNTARTTPRGRLSVQSLLGQVLPL